MRESGRKVSQHRFAELVGVSLRSPGRWENGESEPRMTQLVKIAEVTGRPIGFFFEGASGPTPDQQELFATLLDRLSSTLSAAAFDIRSGAPAPLVLEQVA